MIYIYIYDIYICIITPKALKKYEKNPPSAINFHQLSEYKKSRSICPRFVSLKKNWAVHPMYETAAPEKTLMFCVWSTRPMTDPAGAAIYGAPWIPSRNTPFMLVYIPAPWILWEMITGFTDIHWYSLDLDDQIIIKSLKIKSLGSWYSWNLQATKPTSTAHVTFAKQILERVSDKSFTILTIPRLCGL